METYKYLFGPVPSRRLGISLGVDLVPYKTCNFDCIYCECGPTNVYTNERKEYIAIDKVILELDKYLKNFPKLDFITFSGNGEPLLNKGIDKIIKFLKDKYSNYKLALLTNGSMFYDNNIIKEVQNLDVILPSLDTAIDDTFQLINRPVKNIKIKSIIKGLYNLKKKSNAKIYIEVFIVPQINDTKEELKVLKDVFSQIKPDKIQLNSLDRPSVEDWVEVPTKEDLEKIKKYFEEFNVEIISKFNYCSHKIITTDKKEDILQALKRRPMTERDLLEIFNIDEKQLKQYLNELKKENIIITQCGKRGIFFKFQSK